MSVGGSGAWCYQQGSSSEVASKLMRQYRFTLPGSSAAEKSDAVNKYVKCTLSIPSYQKSSKDCTLGKKNLFQYNRFSIKRTLVDKKAVNKN